MTAPEQVPFIDVEFAENPEPRCPCLLLLDTSGSMNGDPIRELNEGVRGFREQLLSDPLAQKRVEIGIVTFGPVRIEAAFQTADQFVPPDLMSSGDTPMGSAILEGIRMLQERKTAYKTQGISYFRPWIFLITDGAPTDAWSQAAEAVRKGEDSKAFAFFAVGVENADMETLKRIATRTPLKLKGLRFRDLFQWLSSSMKQVSHSAVGSDVLLLPPTTPDGWASV